jgi:bifunctional DNA-binding transcriptional regulator/antitoxin component of YhaV-PrlF toxin-antitoxin module
VHDIGKEMSERIEVDRSEPLEMDQRGRVTIPANIRAKYGIDPEIEGDIWVEVDIRHIEIQLDEDDMEGSA